MALFDFDSIIINNCSGDFDHEALKNTMLFFKRLGIKHFIVTYDVDLDRRPISDTVSLMRTIKSDLKKIKPYACTIAFAPVIELKRYVVQNPSLYKFLFTRKNILFIKLPEYQPWNYEKWLFADINELLYKKEYCHVFINICDAFENYDQEIADKLHRTQRSFICYDAKYITTRPGRIRAMQALGRKNMKMVLSVNKPLKSYMKIENSFERFKKALGSNTYLRFCKYLNDCNILIFPKKLK